MQNVSHRPSAGARSTTIATAVAAAFTLAASSLPGPAQAQPQDNRATTLEEVRVTARKVEESLQDTPVSVTAFSQLQLEQLGVSEAGDVAHYTPNLTMRKQNSSQDNYTLGIRGVNSAENALAIDPTVGIYQDGVYIARNTGAAFDIVDIERIEVLRGPQGTLFGRNTIGGAINIITQQPKREFAFRQSVSYGSRDYQRYQTTVDTPEIGNFAAKLSFLKTAEDGPYKSIYTGGNLGNAKSKAFRLALNWSPSEALSVDYIYNRYDSESNGSIDQLSFVRPGHVAMAGPIFAAAQQAANAHRKGHLAIAASDSDESSSDIEGHSLTVDWTINDRLTLKSISSYREWDSRSKAIRFPSFRAPGGGLVYDSTGLFTGTGMAGVVPAGTLVPLFGGSRESSQQQTSQEFQLLGNAFDSRLTYIAGLYYFEEQSREINPQYFTLPGPFAEMAVGQEVIAGAPFFDYSTDNQSYAVFGQFTYSIIEDLDLTIGARYTVDKKETQLTNTLDGGTQPVTVQDNNDWNNFNPSITLDYRWNEQLSTYFKIATGYRSGGYNVRASTVDSFRSPFDEEEITAYELGWKSDLFDRKLRLNGSIFHMRYSDQQISQFTASGSSGGSTQMTNAGKSTMEGIELEAVFIPTAGLRISASYGYLDLEYKEFEAGVVDRVTGFPTNVNADISGSANRNLYAPEHSASLAVEYQFAPWRIGQLTVRMDASYTDEISFHPQFNLYDASDSHTLVNARATLAEIPAGRNGTFKVALWGKNLENKEYRDFGVDFGQLGFAVNSYGPLRSWGIDFVYDFNR